MQHADAHTMLHGDGLSFYLMNLPLTALPCNCIVDFGYSGMIRSQTQQPAAHSGFGKRGRTMASAQCEPKTEVGRGAPSRIHGQR